MSYAPDKSATYVGIEHITGTIGGRNGGMVLLHDGEFRDGVATADLRIVSGTDELSGATGAGKFRADPAGSMTARPRRRLSAIALVRREAAGGHRSPPRRRDADQALALVDHRLPVLVPVGVLAGDGAVVVDQRLDSVGQVDDLGVAVDLDVGAR